MTERAAEIARKLQKDHKDFSAGRIEVWGIAMVRPNDLSYALVGASAKGDQVEIAFHDGARLVLDGADGLKATPEGIEIAAATQIAWIEAGGEPTVALVRGPKLHLTSRIAGSQKRDLPESPALFLGRG